MAEAVVLQVAADGGRGRLGVAPTSRMSTLASARLGTIVLPPGPT